MADMYYRIYFIDIGSDTLLEYVADNKKYRYAGIRVKDMKKNIVSDGYLERGIEFADIMCKIFGSYGKVYRTGGDEFAAVLCDCGEKQENISEAFHKEIKKWSGSIIKSLTISCGYVYKSEFPDMSVTEIAKIADRRMYEEKSCYYENYFSCRQRISEAPFFVDKKIRQGIL